MVKSFLAFILSVFVFPAPQAIAYSAWLQDYAQLKQGLENRYANLAWFGSIEGGVDLPALDRKSLIALKASRNDQEARKALIDFIHGFHDGHLYVISSMHGSSATSKLQRTTFARDDSATGCTALGYGPVNDCAFSMPFDSLPDFKLTADSSKHPFRAGIFVVATSPALLIGILRIPEFEDNYRSLCVKVWSRNELWDANGKLILEALQRAVTTEWYQALADQLRQFKAAGVAAVLVDIGNNLGGNDSGDIASRLFTNKPIHSSRLLLSQVASSAPYFDEQIMALRSTLGLQPNNVQVSQQHAWFESQKGKLSQPCLLDWVWRERRAWAGQPCRRLVEAGSAGGPLPYLDPHTMTDERVSQTLNWSTQVSPMWGLWTGPLYVLTNSRTLSSAEGFAATLQNNHAAKIVGSRTGGDGCGSMTDAEPLQLSHLGLRFNIPNCVRLRADGTDEVAGVKPDILIVQRQGEDFKKTAQRTLNAIHENLKRASDTVVDTKRIPL